MPAGACDSRPTRPAVPRASDRRGARYCQAAGRSGAAPDRHGRDAAQNGSHPPDEQGAAARPFLSKLTKMLSSEAALATDALTPLPNATLFFFWLLAGLGFYQPLPDGTDMELVSETTTFFEASYETQAARWVCAYRTLTGWVEHRPGQSGGTIQRPGISTSSSVSGRRCCWLWRPCQMPRPGITSRISLRESTVVLGSISLWGICHTFTPCITPHQLRSPRSARNDSSSYSRAGSAPNCRGFSVP